MFEITQGGPGEIILAGRLDASQAEAAHAVLQRLEQATTVDCDRLEYISSAGLGVLLAAQKALSAKGAGLKLVRLKSHILDVFKISGFDQVFEIE